MQVAQGKKQLVYELDEGGSYLTTVELKLVVHKSLQVWIFDFLQWNTG